MRIAIMLLPWLELFTLIELGVKTSALTALVYVFATACIGLAILQRQGRGMLERLKQRQHESVIGPQLLLDDMALGFAGILLVVPGMVTDIFAVIVVIGPLRRRLARAFLGQQPDSFTAQVDRHTHETIEGVYRRLDD